MIYFPAGLIIVLVVFWTIARLEQRRIVQLVADQEQNRLGQAQNLLNHKLQALAGDLAVLAQSEALGSYLASPSQESREELAKRLRSFLLDKGTYDRVSYVDEGGREPVAIRSGERAPGSSSGVDGEEAMVTPVGEGDLAVSIGKYEGGGGESPVSVIHVTMPVWDSTGSRRGTIRLDCPTSRFFDQMFKIFQENGESRLVAFDHQGDPLPGAGSAHGVQSFATEQPGIWQFMRAKPVGQLLTAEGLFTYTRIRPGAEITTSFSNGREQRAEAAVDEQAWYLVSSIPAPELSAFRLFQQGSLSFWLIPLVFAAVTAGAFYLAVNRANKERSDRAVELLSTAIEQSPAAALITDRNGLIQYANPKFLAMSGYLREEIVGQNPRVFKSGMTPEEVYRDLWQTVRAGRVWMGEFRNRRKDRSEYIVAAKISPIMRKSGTISGFLAIQEDITETRRLQQQLERLATVDGLTGIYNRSYFLHLFNQELRREERYGMPLCLLVIDLDHFKAINDTYGHQTGDRVLEEFARAVDSTLRDTDIFGRLGGEEFGVVLLQTDHEGASLLAERLRAAVESMRITCEGDILQVTASIGGTQWERSDSKIEALLNRADSALYAAKKRGRNQVCFRFVEEGAGNSLEQSHEQGDAA